MQTPRFPVTSSLLGPNILLNTMFSNTLGFFSSRNVNDQVSQPYKTTGNIIVLYILIFKFLGSKLEDKRFCTELLGLLYSEGKAVVVLYVLKAYRGNLGIAPLILTSRIQEVGSAASLPCRLTQGKEPTLSTVLETHSFIISKLIFLWFIQRF